MTELSQSIRRPEVPAQRRKVYAVKFLGGAGVFDQEQLTEAVRAASGRVVAQYGDPSAREVSEAEKTALRDVLDALGLVRPDDPQRAMGGRTLSDPRPS